MRYATFSFVNLNCLPISLKISNFVPITKYAVNMNQTKHNSSYYISKEAAVRHLLPHLTYRSGWAKIKEALGDDPCLRRAFSSRSKYLLISEFQYLVRVF